MMSARLQMRRPLSSLAKARRVIFLAVFSSLLGCGGGGGGGGGSAESSVTLENVRYTPIDQEVFEGADPLMPTTVTVDAKGDLQRLNGATLYVVVQDPDALFGSARVSVNANGLNNQLVLEGRPSNAKAGSFSGALTVNVCLDAQCAMPLKGSPFQVPYHVKVLPGLRFNPSSTIALQAAFGAVPAPITVDVALPAGATDFDLTVRDIAGKYGVMGSEKRATSFVVSAGLAQVGNYETSAMVSTHGTTSRGRRVYLVSDPKINYRVLPTPGRTVIYEPAQITLTNVYGGAYSDSQYVRVIASDEKVYAAPPRIEYLPANGNGVLSAGSVAWLDVFPTHLPLGEVRLPIALQIKDACRGGGHCLPPGTYQARVYLRTAAGEENPEPLLVTFLLV